MKQLTMIALTLMLALGAVELPAAPDHSRHEVRPGFRVITPVQIRLNQADRRLVREIEKNRFKIEGLRRENHRLSKKMRFASPRNVRRYARAIERNDRRIVRLERENRYLMRRIRRH